MGTFSKILVKQNDARVMTNANRGPSKGFQGVDTFQYDIFGDPELDQLFLAMDWSHQKRVLVSAFRKSANPMINSMKANIRSVIKHPHLSSGTLEKSIGAYAPRKRIELDVGARRFAPFQGFHGHLLEAGTKDRAYVKLDGPFSKGVEHSTGSAPPTYFFAKAVNATKHQVIGRFRDDRLKAFHDHVAKQNKKNKT